VCTWTYTGQVPAKEIRIRKGQLLRAPVTNDLPQETTVHWLGLAVPNAMDGVAVLSQPAIAPAGSFTDNPGRWIIHCHNDYHLDSGMATFVYYAA
jgi:multicopper oxidase